MRDMDPAAILAYYRDTGGVYERVARLPQPTIAAIAGYCLGGGFELATATDFRVADAGATFGLPEVNIGIVPSSGGTLRLTRLLGTARAKELILLGERFGAEHARSIGLVTEVTPPGESLSRALALARAPGGAAAARGERGEGARRRGAGLLGGGRARARAAGLRGARADGRARRGDAGVHGAAASVAARRSRGGAQRGLFAGRRRRELRALREWVPVWAATVYALNHRHGAGIANHR